MKKSDIYDAFSGIDEKYLKDSDNFEDISAEFRRAKIRTAEKIISFAACLVIAVTAGVNIHDKNNITDRSSMITPSYPEHTDSNEPVYMEISTQTAPKTTIPSETESSITVLDVTGTKAVSTRKTSVKTERFTNTQTAADNTANKTTVTATQTARPVTDKPQSGTVNTNTKPGISYTSTTTAKVTHEPVTTVSTTEAESSRVPQWDEKNITQKFNSFKYENSSYVSQNKSLNADRVGEKLGSVTAKGFDDYEHKTYYADAEIYIIKNISAECAVALKFKGYNEFYVYTSYGYRPDTLGDLIDSVDLENTVSFGAMTLKNGLRVDDYDRDILMSLLKSNRNCPRKGSYSERSNKLAFSTSINLLGISKKVLYVTEDGYIYTNMLELGYSFYIGKEAVQDFFSSLGINNYENVQTKPAPTEEEPIIEE